VSSEEFLETELDKFVGHFIEKNMDRNLLLLLLLLLVVVLVFVVVIAVAMYSRVKHVHAGKYAP
jgi:flagellar basal body-associated protein FliL